MPRHLPSGTQLPRGWNETHDQFICQCEALGYLDALSIVRAFKKKFPEFRDSVITPESLDRRITCLDEQDNDYFVPGMEELVGQLQESGFVFPPMDLEQYAKPPTEIDEDEEATNLRVFGYTGTELKQQREEAERIRPGPGKHLSGNNLRGGQHNKPVKFGHKKANATNDAHSKAKSKLPGVFNLGKPDKISTNEASSGEVVKDSAE